MPLRVLLVALVLALSTACTPATDANATTGSVEFPVAPSSVDGGTIRHVSPRGSDAAAGSDVAPWRTLTYSLEQLRPGDTLLVHGGTYLERVRSPRTTPATPDAPIRVVAAPGERPLVQGLLWLRDLDHWIIDGLDVTWDPATGHPHEHMVKLTDGTGWIFRNAEVWGAHSFAGILVASSGGAEPASWTIAGNCIHDTAPSNDKNQDHLIYVNSGTGSGPGLIQGNLLFGAPNGNGIKLGGPSPTSGGATDVTIRYNTIHGAAQGVLMSWQAQGNRVERNLIGAVGTNYGTIRGYQLSGTGNVAANNVGYQARLMILNDEGYEPVADGGGNVFPLEPAYSSTDTCGGFVPTNATAREYGHLADAVDSSLVGEDPIGGVPTVRASGPDRVATGVAAARHGWERSASAVLARADDPADALAGAALAGALDAPLLITPSQQLAPAVADVLGDLQVKEVVVLGGATAVSDAVVQALRGQGLDVARIAGATREHTAVLIAERLGPATQALLVRGRFADAPERAWPDALAVSGVAAQAARAGTPMPILLAGPGVDAGTVDAMRRLGIQRTVLVGGTSVLPTTTADTLRAAGFSVERWAGSDRYDTSRQVNDRVGVAPVLVVATGVTFPDGLTAGALAARLGGSLLLSPGVLDPVTQTWITDRADTITSLVAVGGTAVLPDATVRGYALAAG